MPYLRLCEFLFLFVALPAAMPVVPLHVPRLPTLLATTLLCGLLLLRDPNFDRAVLWNKGPLGSFCRPLALRAAVVFLLLLAGVLLFAPHHLFFFPAHNPGLWLMVILLYPILSAFPQEFLYRAFFFHRYRVLFPSEASMRWASTLSFAFLHIIFLNPVAPLLSIPGGYLFSHTYARTRSLPAAGIEHAVYGNIVFTVGLGMYFYGGY